MTTTQPAARRPSRWPWVAALVVGLAVLAAIVLFLFLRQDGLPPGASPTPTLEPTPTPTLNPELLSNRMTVLVLGLDGSEGRRQRGITSLNSDTIMLASISADQSEVTLIGIPRDTVDVPLPDGTTWQQKINAIYSINGPEGLMSAIEGLLEIEVDYYVQVDMGDLIKLVDAVDGVEVNPRAALRDRALRFQMDAGRQMIDGETTLDYVRTRADTDYARQARQQEVLLDLVARLADPQTDVDIPDLLGTLFSFNTDLPLDQMPTLIEIATRAQEASVTDQVFNPDDGFIEREGDFGDGRGYVVIPNIDAMRAFAAEHLAQ